jgi:hypothetical protein
MKNIAKQTLYIIASLVTVGGLAVVPVSAERGSSNTDHVAAVEDSTSTTSNTTETDSDSSDGGTDTVREQAKELLQTKRQNVKVHTEAVRQKACEQRQASITRRTANYAAAAQRHLDVFNKIFTKVQAFHDSKQLNVTDYDTLVATATTKQTAAQSAVDTLKALDVQIDCTQADPATSVAAIKSAVADARTALQAYRASIKDVIVALKGASTAQHDTTTSTGDTTDTTDTTGGAQ